MCHFIYDKIAPSVCPYTDVVVPLGAGGCSAAVSCSSCSVSLLWFLLLRKLLRIESLRLVPVERTLSRRLPVDRRSESPRLRLLLLKLRTKLLLLLLLRGGGSLASLVLFPVLRRLDVPILRMLSRKLWLAPCHDRRKSGMRGSDLCRRIIWRWIWKQFA